MANELDPYYRIEDDSGNLILEDASGSYINERPDYSGLVLQDGAICYFRLGESSGNFTDIAGGLTGTAAGSITYSQAGATVGDGNTSILFSTADAQSVTVPGSANLSAVGHSNNLTLEVWATVENNATSDIATPFQFRDPASGGNLWIMAITVGANGGNINFKSTNTGTVNLFTLNVTISTDAAFHHYVCVLDGGATVSRVYMDGQLVGTSSTWSGTPQSWTSGNILLGNGFSNTNPLKGRLDEFAIYPTVLTADQIARHYRCGLQYFDSGIGTTKPAQYPQLLAQ